MLGIIRELFKRREDTSNLEILHIQLRCTCLACGTIYETRVLADKDRHSGATEMWFRMLRHKESFYCVPCLNRYP